MSCKHRASLRPVIPIPPATAIPAVQWPSCWTPPPRPVTSA